MTAQANIESNTQQPKDVSKSTSWRELSALTLLFFATRLPWLFTLPMSQAPDEPNHFWVAQFLATAHKLPTAAEVFSAGTAATYGSLPQFGYLPHVLISMFFPEQSMPFYARFGSLLAGWPTIWAAYAVGKLVFPKNAFAAFALPLLLVFHPQLVFVHSYTNTDSTAASLTSIVILLVVRSIMSGITFTNAILIGFLLGWTALAKHTGLSVVPALGLGLLAAGWLNRESVRQVALKLAAAAAVFFATCLWWFIRNYYEFQGDFLGSKTMYETWAKILPHKDGKVIHPWPKLGSIGYWRFIFFDYWGLFGYMDRYLWRPLYIIWLGFSLTALFGWLKELRPSRPTVTTGSVDSDAADSAGASIQARKESAVWILFLLCPLFNLAANLTATMMNVTGPHGRYLFPSIVPLTALLIAGFYRLGEKPGKYTTQALLALNAGTTIISWWVFYPPK